MILLIKYDSFKQRKTNITKQYTCVFFMFQLKLGDMGIFGIAKFLTNIFNTAF